jgi:hypothetical protein
MTFSSAHVIFTGPAENISNTTGMWLPTINMTKWVWAQYTWLSLNSRVYLNKVYLI